MRIYVKSRYIRFVADVANIRYIHVYRINIVVKRSIIIIIKNVSIIIDTFLNMKILIHQFSIRLKLL